jgi:serine/threonine protein phosphatase PrpC
MLLRSRRVIEPRPLPLPSTTWSLEWALRGQAAPYKVVEHLVADQSLIEHAHESSFLGCFGQDACTVYSNTDGPHPRHVLGVADGVGGWEAYGYDSGVLARDLLARLQARVSVTTTTTCELDPRALLIEAFAASKTRGIVKGGATTACIAVLDVLSADEAWLRTANLGDCGYALFRGNKLIHLSLQQRTVVVNQVHADVPLQMAIVPDHLRSDSPFCEDDPVLADVDAHRVQHGDVVLLSSDGLWDNLRVPHETSLHTWWQAQTEMTGDDDIVDLVAAANNLAAYACERMSHPYSQHTKPDDLVVLLARVLCN